MFRLIRVRCSFANENIRTLLTTVTCVKLKLFFMEICRDNCITVGSFNHRAFLDSLKPENKFLHSISSLESVLPMQEVKEKGSVLGSFVFRDRSLALSPSSHDVKTK